MFTTLGTLSLGWLYPLGDSAIASALEGPGIYDVAKNTDIDETIPDQEYYRNTWVTEDYVRTKWSEGFEVLGFEPCFHYYQDAWVFKEKA